MGVFIMLILNLKNVKKEITLAGRSYKLRKSKYASNFSPVCVSDSMSGKMENIPSISSSCLANPICLQRMQDGVMFYRRGNYVLFALALSVLCRGYDRLIVRFTSARRERDLSRRCTDTFCDALSRVEKRFSRSLSDRMKA